MTKLEPVILRTLSFNLQTVTSLQFLERFLRLFSIDLNGLGKYTQKFELLTHVYCVHMLQESTFLNCKPSLCAAAALMAAINIVQSPLARSLGIIHIPESKMKKFIGPGKTHQIQTEGKGK